MCYNNDLRLNEFISLAKLEKRYYLINYKIWLSSVAEIICKL